MIKIFSDHQSVAAAAADIFVQQAQEAVNDHGSFKVALSGGSTPKYAYELLGRLPRSGQVPWPMVHVFWGDERCVPDDDPRNNCLMARRAMLDKVPVQTAHVHAIHCAGDAAAEAARYHEVLRSHLAVTNASDGRAEPAVPILDLVFLGLGENGHTASLFPGSEVLQENNKWVVEVAPEGSEVGRITLTRVILNAARMVVFLVNGRNKAEVVHRVLDGARDPMALPAQLIQPSSGKLIWLLDQQAAALLERRPEQS